MERVRHEIPRTPQLWCGSVTAQPLSVDFAHARPRFSSDRAGNQARWRFLHTPDGRFVDGDGRDAATCRSHAVFHAELATAFRSVLAKYELAAIPLGRVTG